MGFFQPLLWLMWVFSIFFGFSFSDWFDYLPLGCLLIGLASAGISSFFLARPASSWLKGALCLLALWPIYSLFPLFFLASQVAARTGRWPQVMIDDPKNLLGLSPRYDFWFHATAYTEAFAGAALVSFVALLLVNRERLSPRFTRILLMTCATGMLVSIVDPGQLCMWWID